MLLCSKYCRVTHAVLLALTLNSSTLGDEIDDLLDLFSTNRNAGMVTTFGLTDNDVIPIGTLAIDLNGSPLNIDIETLRLGLGGESTDISLPQRVETAPGVLNIYIPENVAVSRGSSTIINNVPVLQNGDLSTSGTYTNNTGALIVFDGTGDIEASEFNNLGRLVVKAGSSSSITASGGLNNASIGTLAIDDGSSFSLTGGDFTNSGTANVNGGVLNSSSDIDLENGGLLDIRNGGDVTSDDADIGSAASGSPSSVTVTNLGSSWTVNDLLTVGSVGQGTLAITNRARVVSSRGRIGDSNGSDGSVIVDGPNSQWINNGNQVIGNSGKGSLAINNKGFASNSDLVIIGNSDGDTGSVAINGQGSAWSNLSELRIGSSGNGNLSITSGGEATSANAVLGLNTSGKGTVTVAGAGSVWTNSGDLFVGDAGNGTLDIQNGGTVSNEQGRISNSTTAIGSVTVDGVGSMWSNTGQTRVGQSGTGTLTISNGGAVSGTAGVIGAAGTGDGEAEVIGDGSLWDISGTMVVAENGLGMLRIENGGNVSNQNGSIGFNSGSNGSVIVDGAGSTWTNNISLYIGGTASSSGGTGALTIQNEGNVTVVNDVKLWTNGTLNLAGGILKAASFDPTLGTFDWTDGTLAVEHYNGSLIQSGGTLALGSSPGVTTINGEYTIESNGTLEIELFDNDGASPVAGVDFDQLVSMEANLAGTLNLVVDAGYIPTLGDIFPIVSASGGVSGTFDMVFGDYLGEGLGFDIQYNATDVTLEVVNMLPGDFD